MRKSSLITNNTTLIKEKLKMAKIAISELRPAGADLFDGSESFLQELTDAELVATKGGNISVFTVVTPISPFIPIMM